jgi:hypothetical protein
MPWLPELFNDLRARVTRTCDAALTAATLATP